MDESRLESWEMSSVEAANTFTLSMTAFADCTAAAVRTEPCRVIKSEILRLDCCKVAIVLAFFFSTLLSLCCFFLHRQAVP